MRFGTRLSASGSTSENTLWRHFLHEKKVDLRIFLRQEKCIKCAIIHESYKFVHTVRIDNVLKQYAELLYNNLYNGENEVGPDSRHVTLSYFILF